MKTTQTAKENPAANKSLASMCLASCQKFAAQVERAKNNLVAEFRGTFAAHEQLLNHVINQADALAWQTDYPHLLFPSLALEKVQAAADWNERQQFMQRTNRIHAIAA